MKNLILLLFFLSTTSWAISPWGNAAREELRNFKLDIEDPYISTLWGSCEESNPILLGKEKLEILSEHFKNPLEVKLKLHKYPGFTPRPLVVIIPGVFVKLNGIQSRNLSKLAFKSGAHVLTFPNPLSTDYIGKGAINRPADIEAEGQTIYKGIIEVLEKVRARNILISDVKLIGVSYGAFVSAIIAAKDALNQRVISNTYLLSPPFNMYQTMKKVDGLLDSISDRFVWSKFPLILPYMEICWKDKYDKEDSLNAKLIVSLEGFHHWLYQSVQTYQMISKDFTIPGRSWGILSSHYRKWFKNLRFVSITNSYAPDLVKKMKGEKGRILHWINIAEKKDGSKVHILSSEDDFLNSPSVWPKKEGVIVLKNGGHFGIRGMPWFENFLVTALKESYVKRP